MGRIGIRQGCGFDSRRLHQLTQVTSMTWVLRSRRRHYLSTVYAVSVETPRHSGDFSRFSLSLTPQRMAKKFGTIRLLAMEVSRRRCESSEILLAPFGVSARPTSS